MTGWRGKTLLVGAGAMYAGLFLAGMSWAFAVAWPVGIAVLLLYTVLMRPVAQWGGSGGPGAVRFGLTLAVLGAIAALLAGAGQGAASLLGAPWLWLGPCLAFGGVALSRSVWSAGKAADMDAFLDEAIGSIEGIARQIREERQDVTVAPSFDDLTDNARETIRLALTRLAGLTPARTGSDTHAMIEILETLEERHLWEVALDQLAARREDPAVAEAHLRLATRPYVAMMAFGSGTSLAAARDALRSGNSVLAVALAEEARATMAGMPEFWRELPPADELHAAADAAATEAASAALRDLAARVEALATDDAEADSEART